MIRLFMHKKGQSTAEYAILFAIVIGVLSGMQLYLRRGLSARLKDASDNIPLVISKQADLLGNGANWIREGSLQYDSYVQDKGAYEWNSTDTTGNTVEVITNTGGLVESTGASSLRDGSETQARWTESN